MKPTNSNVLSFLGVAPEDVVAHTQVVCLSGGMDSTTMLSMVRELSLYIGQEETFAVGFDYGQRHKIELEYAEKVASYYAVPFHVITLPVLQEGVIPGSPLVDSEVEVPAQEDKRQIATVVPYRNLLFAVNAAIFGYIASKDPSKPVNVWMGAVRDDYEAYRDCRMFFFNRLNRTFRAGSRRSDESASVITPLIRASKKEIVDFCRDLNVPWHLTHTCYKGVRPGCGVCDACKERVEAFASNDLKDPLFS